MSSVGRQPAPPENLARFPAGRCGSGFRTEGAIGAAAPNLTPVTCCTIWRKLAGSAVMKVVWERLEARDFLLEILPVGCGPRRRGAESWSEPERLETVGVAVAVVLVSGFVVKGVKSLSSGKTAAAEREF